MRAAQKYLMVGASAALAVGAAGVASATSGQSPDQTTAYLRYIDAGNTAGPITVGERTWESQTGFTGGTVRTVQRAAPGLAPSVGRSVLAGPSSFAVEIPDGKYRVQLWVRRSSRAAIPILAEGSARTLVQPLPSGSHSNWRRAWVRASLVVRVSDGSLNLAFGSDSKLVIAALAIQGRAAAEPAPSPTTTPTTAPSETTTPTSPPPTTPPATTTQPPATTTQPPVTTPPTTAPASTTPAPTTSAPVPNTSTPTTQPPSRTCTNPVFVTSDPNGGWSTGGYYVHNNMWNVSDGGGPETLYACSYNNWYVTSTQPDTTSVKTYPNVHKDYNNVPLSSFRTITSTFAATSPHTGIYNVAYDIWLNGVATSGSTELMIWTENYKQRPSGSIAATLTLGGQTYDVWKTSDSHYIAFVPKTVMTSGNINLLEIFKWTISKGWMPSSSTVGQIDYGVEICSTEGKPATFRFTDFSITDD